jgi:hypothetical protein
MVAQAARAPSSRDFFASLLRGHSSLIVRHFKAALLKGSPSTFIIKV